LSKLKFSHQPHPSKKKKMNKHPGSQNNGSTAIAAPHKPLNSTSPTRVTIARHAYITQTPHWQERDLLSQKNGPHATVFMVNGDRYLGEWEGNKKHGTFHNEHVGVSNLMNHHH
jgi:hypothetical protein